MRVLFTSLPATGHFNSLLPLAEAVADGGHEVAIACMPALAARVTDAGFTHLPSGAETFEELFPGPPPPPGPDRIRWVQREVFAGRAVAAMLPDLERHVASWRPDVIVRESAEFAGCLAAERAGLPHAAVATGSRSALAEHGAIVSDVIDRWRRRLGMPPDPEGATIFRHLLISFMPERWDGGSVPPPTTRFVRYENPRLRRAQRPDWLDEPRDRPLVFASLGTLHHREAGVFDAILQAVADEPVAVVAAIGDSVFAGPTPANVRIETFVPQVAVLERTSVFITHGGFNSTKEALSLGIPLVVIPITADQPYTAERVEALGLGRRIGPEERTPDAIRTALRDVLTDPAYRANARRFADDMAALPGVAHAVALLEQLV